MYTEKTGELRAAETQRADLAAKTSALEEMVSRLDEEVKLQGKRAADVEEHKKQLVCRHFVFNELNVGGLYFYYMAVVSGNRTAGAPQECREHS